MQDVIPVLLVFLGVALGASGIWWINRLQLANARRDAKAEVAAEIAALKANATSDAARITELQSRVHAAEEARSEATAESATHRETIAHLKTVIEDERRQSAEKLALLNEAQTELANSFKALAADALSNNNRSFLELAKTNFEKMQATAKGDLDKRQQAIDALVKPVSDSLDKFDEKIQQIEKERTGAYQGLVQQVDSMRKSQQELRTETNRLVRALGTPTVRGRWGEIQLRRVVEMAGMLRHCDFFEQKHAETEESFVRPDLLVRLPGEKSIVVDAKVSLTSYLEAHQTADDQERILHLKQHAKNVRSHITALSRKSYTEHFDNTPEFVVLFMPGEMFFSAALEHDPSLIEAGVDQNVVIATPTTLIALLRAIAYGWKQEQMTQSAVEISNLGKELYKRLASMGKHISAIGKSLDSATKSYNKAVGSLETRVLVTARKFDELEVASTQEDIEQLPPLDHVPRKLQAPELTTSPVEPPAPTLFEGPDEKRAAH